MSARFRLALLGLLLTVAGCGDDSFHGKDISHLMPALEFTLTDETGREITEQALAGRPVALYFGFARCPDVCPTTLAKLAAARRGLPEALAERLQLVFVSVDPARDTPERLAEYTAAFAPDMLGATGSQDQLQTLTRRYRITYGYETPDAEGNYQVSHASAVFVFDADLNARLMLLDGLDIGEMRDDLERVLEPGRS